MLIRRALQHFTRRSNGFRFIGTSSAPQASLENDENEPAVGHNAKLLKVAIVGTPNAGKSTLINALMDRKVCAASSKVHTTRNKARAIFTDGDCQIIFTDTPGLVHYKEVNKYNLEKSFLRDPKSMLLEADIIGVIHDVSNAHTRNTLDIKVINLLEHKKSKPSFLVLNKIDLLKSKRKLLDITRIVTEGRLNGVLMPNAKPHDSKDARGWPNFSEIFMISALTMNGMDDLRNYLVSQAKPAKWMYAENVWSDQTPEKIIVNTVKAQLLNYLQEEIPYQCIPAMEFFEMNEHGGIKSVVLVKCPTDRIAKLIAGVANGRLRQITENIQRDLQSAFQNFVMINIVLTGPSVTFSL